jgi:hypothetical protein
MKAADLNHAFAIAVNMSRIWTCVDQRLPQFAMVADLKKFATANGSKCNDDVRAEMGDKFLRHIYHSSSAKMTLGNSRRLERLIYPRKLRIHCFMDHQADGHSRDLVLGPPLCRIYERSAVGPLPPTAPAPPSFGVFVRRASKMLGWWMRGLARPTPFFDDSTNAPYSVPRVLTRSERAAL